MSTHDRENNLTVLALELVIVAIQAWINLQVMTPSLALLTLLRISRQQHLDILKEEVAIGKDNIFRG